MNTKDLLKYNSKIKSELKSIIGKPKKFCVLLSGSLAKNQNCIYSDIDILILHDDNYFNEPEINRIIYNLYNYKEKKVLISTRSIKEAILIKDLKTYCFNLGLKYLVGDKLIYYKFLEYKKDINKSYFNNLYKDSITRLDKAYILPDIKECPGGYREASLILDILSLNNIKNKRIEKNINFIYKIRFLIQNLTKKNTNKLDEGVLLDLIKILNNKNLLSKIHKILRENAVFYRNLLKKDFIKISSLKEYIYTDNKLLIEDLYSSESIFKLIPTFNQIKALPENYNIHKYTVDQHLIYSLICFNKISKKDNFFYKILNTLDQNHREILKISLLMHDIGKFKKKHSLQSFKIGKKYLNKISISKEQKNLILYLIKNHHLVYNSITKKDIEDKSFIKKISKKISTILELKLLIIFTYCDLNATNNLALNTWLLDLVKTFYYKLYDFYLNKFKNINTVKKELKLKKISIDKNLFKIIETLPIKYIENSNLNELINTASLIKLSIIKNKNFVKIEVLKESQALLYIIINKDRVGLIHSLSKVFRAYNISIVYASIYTLASGEVFDKFKIVGAYLNKAQNILKLEASILKIINNNNFTLNFENKIHNKFNLKITNKNSYTILELKTLDSNNLINYLTYVFCKLNINISYAKISTFGKIVNDLFYLSTIDNKALDKKTIKKLKNILLKSKSLF